MNTIIFTKLGFYEDQMMKLNYIKYLTVPGIVSYTE